MMQKNSSKSTRMIKVSQTDFHRLDLLHDRVFELISFTQKRKREYFRQVILSAVALPIVLKAEFNFELILYITIFVF